MRLGRSSTPDSVNDFDNGTLKITELFSTPHSSGNVCLKRCYMAKMETFGCRMREACEPNAI